MPEKNRPDPILLSPAAKEDGGVVRRSTLQVIAGIATMVAGILGFCLWSAFVPAFINGFQALTLAFFVSATGAVWWGIGSRMRRREPRFPVGQCGRCGYSLTGNVSGVCPECGTPARAEKVPSSPDPPQLF